MFTLNQSLYQNKNFLSLPNENSNKTKDYI